MRVKMKRLFTIVIVAMIASLTFAQSPLARKKTASINKLERVADVKTMAQKAKEAKEMQAAMAIKAAVAQDASTSLLRKSSVRKNFFGQVKATAIKEWMLGSYKSELLAKPHKSSVRKTTTQEGNVTITTEDNGMITDVAGVEPKMYARSATGTAYFLQESSMVYGQQSGMVTVIEDGDNVYIKNPITNIIADTWVRGKKSGNTITVATRQLVTNSIETGETVSLRWGVITATGQIKTADDHAEAFTFTVDGNVLTLEGTSAYQQGVDTYFMGLFWDGDNTATGYGDAETVLTYDPNYVAPSTELVTLPAGVEYTGWYLNGVSVSSNSETAIKNQSVNVAFVDKDVYVQGLSEDFPEAWVKGSVDGTTITFGKFQFVGTFTQSGTTYNCWFIGVDASGENAVIKDAVATYDADAKTITFTDEVLINADEFKVLYLGWYSDVVLSADEKEYVEPIITDLTAELPYTNTFETEEEQAQAAIYDANEDQSTFSFAKHDNGSMVARCIYNSKNYSDDYLVFPGMELKAGKKYKVSIDAASYTSSYVERVEVVAGTVAKASQLTIPVIAPTELPSSSFVTLSNKAFTVEADGTYYLAVHAISDPNKLYLYVDNFSIAELDTSAPATVSDLTVVADAQGANKATVTFTVPATTISGTAITEPVKVAVSRDGEEILSAEKTAGEKVSFEDEVAEAGYHTYSVVASYGTHLGESADTKTYIGYDTPGAVEDLTATDKSGSVGLTWSAPTEGANGFIVNPADFKYNVYPVEIIDFFGMQLPMTDYDNPYATGLTETSATVEYNTNEGEQGFTYFAVTTENTTAEGEDVYAAVVTGAPYEMPFLETVAGGELSYWWGYASDAANSAAEGGLYIGEKGSDDATSFEMYAATAGWINLQSGKIDLAGKTNPVLTFDHAADSATPLTVSVITPKGKKEVGTFTAGADFATATVSLVEFANEDWVRIIITGTFAAEGSAYIDRIRVYNQLDNNLAAKDITATSKVSAGEDVKIAVAVENQGAKVAAAGAYTVDLYCNDAKVQTLAGTELASDSTTTFEFTEKTTVMSPSELVWKAVIEFADDADKSNDTTKTVKTVINTTNYPAVTDLAAVQNGDAVSLTWSEPDMTNIKAEPVTDSFEDYESFALNAAGDWSFVDVDGGNTYGFESGSFPNMGSPMAYIVFDNSIDEFSGAESFAANTGSKYMASFATAEGKNDDWMISPELSGDEQIVSFFARSYTDMYGLESFEFYYSTTGKAVADFIKLDGDDAVPTAWHEYSYNIPAGAKYFAIRCTSADKFIFFVDDVTYTPAGMSSSDLAIVGYNVYRDGVKLNAEPVAEPAYTDATATVGSHDYVVTVVYDKGESAISNIVTLNVTTGIDGIAGKTVRISTADKSIVVTNAAGENVSVYTVDGKAVYDAAGTDINSVKVESGVYIVKVGKTVVKTVVR